MTGRLQLLQRDLGDVHSFDIGIARPLLQCRNQTGDLAAFPCASTSTEPS